MKKKLLIFLSLSLLSLDFSNAKEEVDFFGVFYEIFTSYIVDRKSLICFKCSDNLIEYLNENQNDYSLTQTSSIYDFNEIDAYGIWIFGENLGCQTNFTQDLWEKSKIPRVIQLPNSFKSNCFKFIPQISLVRSSNSKEIFVYGEYQNDLQLLSIWKKETGFVFDMKNIFASEMLLRPQRSFEGKTLTVSATGQSPYVHFEYGKPISFGSDLDIIREIAKKLNFQVQFKKELVWMYKMPKSGKLIGIIPSVYERKSQLGIGLLSLKYDRYQLVDYTPILYDLPFYILSRKPSIVESYINIFRPFDKYLWMFLALVFVLVSFVFVLLDYTMRKSNHFESWIVVFKMCLSQTVYESQFQTLSQKILLFLCFITISFLIRGYCSQLRSALTLINYEKEINNLQDILDLDQTLYLLEGSNLVDFFKNWNNPLAKKVFKKTLSRNAFYSIKSKDIMFKVYERKGLVLGEPNVFYNGDWTGGMSSYRLGSQLINNYQCGFVMIKNNPSNLAINKVVTQLLEAGIINHLIESKVNQTVKYFSNTKDKIKMDTFTLTHLAFPLMLLPTSLIISLIIFIIEYFKKKDRYYK